MSSLDNKNDEPSSADRFWRSIDELSQTPEVLQLMQQEFPDSKGRELSGLSRRQFTRLMAASMALAGVNASGCRRWPEQTIQPQSNRQEGFLPGQSHYYATQFELGGVSTGILAKNLDGRPIKIEGNHKHPFSNGAAGVFAQASVLEMYDPDRTQGYVYRPQNAPEKGVENSGSGDVAETKNSRESFEQIFASLMSSQQRKMGRGLHVLAQANSSPTRDRLRKKFQEKFPQARWHTYQPLDRDNELAGSKLAFGDVYRPQYKLHLAKTIVLLDSDLLGSHPAQQKWCRDWAEGRNPNGKKYSRMWAFESGYSISGAAADIRVPIQSSQILNVVLAIAESLGISVESNALPAHLKSTIRSLTEELRASASESLLVAGPSQPPEVHQLVHAINSHLGCTGKTVGLTEEPLQEPKSCVDSLSDLVGALSGKSVETLLILDGNPLFDAPADAQLTLANGSNLTSIYLGLFDNETAGQCTWHVPAAHYLECWNDGRAWDGTYGVGQPLIHPLFDGMSQIEFLSLAIGNRVDNGMSLVRETARESFGVDTDQKWKRLLHDGIAEDSRFKNIVAPQVQLTSFNQESRNAKTEKGKFEIVFQQDQSVYDGRFANNGWLQELPDPLSKLTWDNAALISKHDADQLNLRNGDTIEIGFGEELSLESIPVLIQPGQANGTVSLPLGYGHRNGFIAEGIGANAFSIRTSSSRFFAANATLKKTGRTHELACTQEHHLMDAVGQSAQQKRVGEPAKPGLLVRETTLRGHQHDPDAVHAGFHVPKAAPLFDQPSSFDSPCSWGMTIDLNSCVGCNACVVACQSENNIPIVGKANVIQNREMHWIRIDRYFKGDVESPDVVHVPMACAHCEDAPCEQVCPVAATVHDTEGLNAMVYNRCVGTRYCANNCPYKVRRFNYFDYHASNPKTPATPWLGVPDQQTKSELTELEQMKFNPDVTVRMRGVMEKCTYCVQRISNARIQARNEHASGKRADPSMSDGEVVTACQQACPTQAIRFGDLNDANSMVSKAQQDARSYSMLEETNIKPRTRFLAKIRNVDDGEVLKKEVEHDHD